MSGRQKCNHCQETGTIEVEEHHWEKLLACRSCGSTQPCQEEQLTPDELTIDHFYHKVTRPAGESVFRRRATAIALPRQTSGFVIPKLTDARRECLRLLRTAIDKLGLSNSGSVAAQARNILRGFNLVGRTFKRESVAAACVYVASLNHSSDTALATVTKILDVDIEEVRRVIKRLRHTCHVLGEARAEANSCTSPSARRLFSTSQFLKSDGSRTDNDQFIGKVIEFLNLCRQPDRSKVIWTDEYFVAAAYMVYKSDDLPHRRKLTLHEFVLECRVSMDSVDRKLVEKAMKVLVTTVKSLVQELPFVDMQRVKTMNRNNLLAYLPDIKEHKETVIFLTNNSNRSHGAPDPDDPASKAESAPEESDSDGDMSTYIRSAEEVENLQPLYSKLLER